MTRKWLLCTVNESLPAIEHCSPVSKQMTAPALRLEIPMSFRILFKKSAILVAAIPSWRDFKSVDSNFFFISRIFCEQIFKCNIIWRPILQTEIFRTSQELTISINFLRFAIASDVKDFNLPVGWPNTKWRGNVLRHHFVINQPTNGSSRIQSSECYVM